MALTKLKFRPGINRDISSYSNENGWLDGNKIRFRLGYPEKIGGWEKYSGSNFLGTARALHNWVSLDGNIFLGIGTSLKYYIEQGLAFNDITPLRETTSAGDVTFSATNGSSVITITDTAHGATQNDFVTFSGAASLGGLITATVLNQEYQIVDIPSANTYTISAKDTSGNSVVANSSDTGNGGSSTVGAYQINVGLDNMVGGTGWNAGTWGRGTWNSSASVSVETQLRLWSHDNFGEDLLINPRDGGIFLWDKTNGTGTRAVEIGTLSGASGTPNIAQQVLVSDSDRHVIAFGTNTLGTSTQDNLLIRFSDQESAINWTPTTTNTAGSLKIGSGSRFVRALQTKREILVWTDTSLHSMTFIGPPFTFGIQQLASNITIIGPNAAVAVEDTVYWMGRDNFYVYNGSTTQLACNVKEKVFFDFNTNEEDKVFAGVNSNFNEIWWFYPSTSATENDSYVIYNYAENLWYYGTLSRTAWIDRGIKEFPLATGNNYLFNHEKGYDDDGSAMASEIESSQMDIGEGEQFIFINRIIPDLTFNGSTASSPGADFTLKTRNFPGANYSTTDSETVTRSATSTTVPFEQFTNQAFVRLRGRSFAFKISSSNSGVRWRLGSPRIDFRSDGKR
jgi:hypothetical protein